METRSSSTTISNVARSALRRAREGKHGIAWATAWLAVGVYRSLWRCNRAMRSMFLKVYSAFLHRWGYKLGVSGNRIGRVLGKANRTRIVKREGLYAFLSQETPNGNYYPTAPRWSSRSQTILNILGSAVSTEDRFLEIGCNQGRNLNHLWGAGYRNLRGIEISEHAVKRLRHAYPSLTAVVVDVGPAETIIPQFQDKAFDLVFTMSVLEHLHPDSKGLFGEIARVAKKYVLAIEPRKGKASHCQYPWDIRQEFVGVGLRVVNVRPWSAFWEGPLVTDNEWADVMNGYDAFLFSVEEPPTHRSELTQQRLRRD